MIEYTSFYSGDYLNKSINEYEKYFFTKRDSNVYNKCMNKLRNSYMTFCNTEMINQA